MTVKHSGAQPGGFSEPSLSLCLLTALQTWVVARGEGAQKVGTEEALPDRLALWDIQ